MIKRLVLVLVLSVLGAFILPNLRSLYEGILFYMRDAMMYNPNDVKPISRTGRYASLYDLVQLRNDERRMYILNATSRATVLEVPIPGSSLTNIFVRFDSPGPYTIFAAHYDKLYDEPAYQGASDNTAAVSVLLAAIDELMRRGDAGNRAFLFIGEEETGIRGASAFVEYARANQLPIHAIINFDNIGRSKLAIRPSATLPGFVFTLPLLGDFVFDGRTLNPSPAYPPANPRLAQSLLRAQPDLIVYERFTALGDSNVFQANGIDTVAISASDQYYLEQTWHTYADRIELLDERNLDRAFDLIINVSNPPNEAR